MDSPSPIMDSDSDNQFLSDDYESADSYLDDSKQQSNSSRKPNYSALTESDITQRIEELVTLVSDVLCIPKSQASLILRYYNWTVSEVHDAWFIDEFKVREKVGLLIHDQTSSSSSASNNTCGICFESFNNPKAFTFTPYCAHAFCNDCFASYIDTSINDGPGCLKLKCPQFSCNAAVDQGLIDRLVSKENRDKYSRYLIRSYVEDNKTTKWCPAPGCESAVQFEVGGGGGGGFDVSCCCAYNFCWNCAEEAHRPVGCDAVVKWMALNKSDGFSIDWILVNTRPCPKCRQPIEKNGGCMRMTCKPPCGYQFCWLCRAKWDTHGYNGPCNGYKQEKNNETTSDITIRGKNLEKYAHYYQRWAANNASYKKALTDLKQLKTKKIEKLCESQCQTDDKLKFLTEAWVQITECRRVLKWSYVYGYYLAEENIAKKQLFEYSQGEAESALERLHQCAEEEIKEFYESTSRSPNWGNYRIKLTDLTKVTKNFFDNLVIALENGLPGVEPPPQSTCETKKRRRGGIFNK